jgi:hypothetical protein
MRLAELRRSHYEIAAFAALLLVWSISHFVQLLFACTSMYKLRSGFEPVGGRPSIPQAQSPANAPKPKTCG